MGNKPLLSIEQRTLLDRLYNLKSEDSEILRGIKADIDQTKTDFQVLSGESTDLETQKTIKDAIEITKDFDDYVFNICLNYGGRQEIVRAAKLAFKDIKEGKIKEEDLNIDTFKNYLYSSGLPEVDLMIRTSGEKRLSNFLLYQLAYSEFIFTDTYWPDFTPEKLIECLKEYESRDRRFGAIKE